jgi:cell division protease FtsH
MPPVNKWQFRFSIWYIVVVLALIGVMNYFVSSPVEKTIDFSDFKARVSSGEIKRVELDSNYFIGFPTRDLPQQSYVPFAGRRSTAGTSYRAVAINDPNFIGVLDAKGVAYAAVPQQSNFFVDFLLSWVVPFILLFFVWRFLFKRVGGGMGSNVLQFGQNKAQVVAEGDVLTRFSDVAGADEAKDELIEVVDFLKTPKKYTEIGGKIPKGVLLVGPPGTGKTLLARAVAGEAKVPFFRMSGADFVEMFVGVGASRVRDLFRQAREKAPCIIFIDELDAIGKSRINGMGGNDEREQTLNQLLVEMDGFDSTTGLIILAATNRPDVLDPALMRPGRFDRQVLVDRPDLIGREAILKIHSKNVKMEAEVDLNAIARATAGFVGADLANIVNEAALLAVRGGRKLVAQRDFSEAIEKVVAGLEKKSRVINPEERKTVAFHETGHALVAGFTAGADPVQKISIVPRGLSALGYTLQTPTEDRYLMTEDELYGKIDVLLGGRAAEEIEFGRVSTGAANDLTRATDIARRMITDYGMSAKFRNMVLTQRGSQYLGQLPEPGLLREYSETTQQYVDEEIARMLAERYERVKTLLAGKRDLLAKIAGILLEKETIDEKEFKEIIAA